MTSEVETRKYNPSLEATNVTDPIVKIRKLFHVSPHACRSFKNKADTLNPGTTITGWIVKREGPYAGSLMITEVNGVKLTYPQAVYGTPKLQYPYTKEGYGVQKYKTFSAVQEACKSFVLANKWNGSNILFYKYKDAKGNVLVTAKSKGSCFLNNTAFGDFLDLSLQALGVEGGVISMDALPKQLEELKDPKIQSKCFELCGRKEPHLVKYDFDIALKPLFITYIDGVISPCSNKEDLGPFAFEPQKMIQECSKSQQRDLEANVAYRRANNLKHRYEFDHFITEGRVLYLLNANGCLLNRIMYKVKPKDIEEVHWANFDDLMEGRVKEAVEKVILRSKPFSEESIKEELDMGPKEWGKFGVRVMKYAQQIRGRMPSVGRK